jgi:hypothetical protein
MPPDAKRSGPDTTPDRSHKDSDLAAEAKPTIPPAAITGRRCGQCGGPLAPKRRRFCSDLCRVRGQRSERVTETGEFGRAAIRMIRAMARRVGASDIAEFGVMWETMTEAEHAVTEAIDHLRAAGFSWAEISAEIGWGRQRLTQWRQRRGEFPPQRNVAADIPESGAAV